MPQVSTFTDVLDLVGTWDDVLAAMADFFAQDMVRGLIVLLLVFAIVPFFVGALLRPFCALRPLGGRRVRGVFHDDA